MLCPLACYNETIIVQKIRRGLGIFMQCYQKLIHIIKLGIIGFVLSFIIISSALPATNCGQQELNLKSSILISIGFGASICMVKDNRRKVNNYT